MHAQGIRAISAQDIEVARKLGYAIKMLAIGHRTDSGIDVRVHPAMIPASHPLAGVSGAMNAVYVVGDAVGETMFYGAGAGAFPTASAVVGDVLALAEPLSVGTNPLPEPEPFKRELAIHDIRDLSTRYYVRIVPGDTGDAQARAEEVLTEHGIATERVMELEDGSFALVTGAVCEGAMTNALAEMAHGEGAVREVANAIRIEDMAAWTEGVEAN